MIINKKSPLTLSILTGIFLGTSIIPFPPWAMFFCFTPLFYIWLTETSPKKVFLYTSLSFFIGTLIGFFWMAHLLTKFALLPFPISVVVTLFFGFLCHIHFAFLGFAFSKWIKRKSTHPILTIVSLFSFIWIVTPLLFPWNFSLGWLYAGLQGYQFADIIGAYGINTVTIFINGALLFSFLKIKNTKSEKQFTKNSLAPLLYTLLFLITFNFAGFFYGKSKVEPATNTIKVAIAQSNIGNLQLLQKKFGYSYKKVAVRKYTELTDKAIKASGFDNIDLAVWPETAFPQMHTPNFLSSWSGKTLEAFVQKRGLNLITGLFSRSKDGKVSNSALPLNREGKIIDSLVHKKILLSFGEYLPGESYFPFLRTLFPMVGDFKPGESPQVRSFDTFNLGLQICYEGLFPGFSRDLFKKGANIFVNLTNDSWYGPHSEPLQHLYTVAFRAIEQRVPFIRSTNTGISTVILPSGEIMKQSPLNKEWSHVYEVPVVKNPTPTLYQRFGYLLTLPFLLIMFIISIVYDRKRN